MADLRNASLLLLVLAALGTGGCKDKGDPSSAASDDDPPPSPEAVRVTEAASAEAKKTSPMAKVFNATDADGNGKVTRDEARDYADEKFKALDKNGDKVLDEEEIAAEVNEKLEETAKARLALLDRNHDGKVSREEMPPPLLPRFEKLDTNSDGFVSIEDMRERRAREPASSAMSPLTQLDQDGDGKVSLGEYTFARIDWFARADHNQDGEVTLEEAETAVPAHATKGMGAPGSPGGMGRPGMMGPPGMMPPPGMPSPR